MIDEPKSDGAFTDGSSVSTLRAMLLCAAGALIGLGIAGYGLFTASGTSTRHVPPEVLAMVNQRPILRSDFVAQLESETGKRFADTSRADQLNVLDEMVREELLVQRALELDFAETDQNARNALAAAISEQAIAEVTTSQPSDQQLRDYFQRHPQRWATEGVMSLREFILPSSTGRNTENMAAQARRAVDELRAASSVDQVVTTLGLKEGARQDQEYYFTIKFRLGDSLFDAIQGLSEGQISDPVPLKDGIHIVQMIKNARPVPLSFESARSQVSSDYNEAERQRIMNSTMTFLRSRARILIAPDYQADYKP
jgi:parvulin-like peptidyl-prolyl isomerase